MTDTTTRSAFPVGTIIGYPRIGRRRELKKAVESFWAGSIDEDELEATAASLRAATRERLAALSPDGRFTELVEVSALMAGRP